MRNLLIVVAFFGITLVVLNVNRSDSYLLPLLSSTSADQEQFFELEALYDQRTSFSDMPELGAYTIVEVYADDCGRCKVLEAEFPALLSSRGDIVIKRVKVFSGGVRFDSQQAADKWLNRQDSMRDFYQMRGTPHIEIYDSNGTALAKDAIGENAGTDLLEDILKANS